MAPPSESSHETFQTTVKSSINLIDSLLKTADPTSATATESSASIDHSSNPLETLGLAATVLRAQVTKLSLLAITEPFTPSAICSVLKEICTSALPTLWAGLASVDAAFWSRGFAKQCYDRVRWLTGDLRKLLVEVEGREAVASGRLARNGNEAGVKERGKEEALASTGVVWKSCDAVIALKNLDVGGVMSGRAKVLEDFVKDVLDEMGQLREESAEEGEDDAVENGIEDDDSEGSGKEDSKALIENIDSVIPKLRLMHTLFIGVRKRRTKTVPSWAERTKAESPYNFDVKRLDSIMDNLTLAHDEIDEVGMSLHSYDFDEAESSLRKVLELGFVIADLSKLDWMSKPDEFSSWCEKWIKTMRDKS